MVQIILFFALCLFSHDCTAQGAYVSDTDQDSYNSLSTNVDTPSAGERAMGGNDVYPLNGGPMPLSAGKDEINYLVKITNNYSKPFRLFCNNFKWRPFLFGTPQQLVNAQSPDRITPSLNHADQDFQHLHDLYSQQQERYDQLIRDHKSKQDVEQDQLMINYDRVIGNMVSKLRPVIQPGQTIDNLSCRLYRKKDMPTDPTSHWQLPRTFLQADEIKIEVIDTQTTTGCPDQRIRIEARTKTQTTFTCVDNTGDYGKVHLIINEDGTLKLEPVLYITYK
jgi:hypothetical protein